MPIEAELPDGTILEFPDGTADGVIQAQVKQQLGATAQPSSDLYEGRTRMGGADAKIGARPGFGERAFNYTRNIAHGLGQLSPAYRMASKGEPLSESVVNALKSWLQMGGNLARSNPAELLTAPAGDIGDLVGLERPPGSELRDPAEAAVNLAMMPLLAEEGGSGALRMAPSVAERVGAKAATSIMGRGAQFARNRAAARSLDLQRPTTGRAATAEDIAFEVIDGTPSLEGKTPGVGVGTRRQLAQRARARQALASQEQEMLQNVDTPIDVAPVSGRLRADAQRRVTQPPPHTAYEEVDTGLVDAAGDPIMGIKQSTVPGQEMTQDPALVGALRGEADFLDDLASQYPDNLVPGGELFKQRATTGARIAKAYEKLPGDVQTAANQAGKSFKANLTEELRTQLPDVPVAQVDRAYRVWRNAAVNFERSRLTALTSRGMEGLRDLMVGRLGGIILGASADVGMGGYGVAGALTGLIAGESAVWGSLRAQEYARLSRLLNSGETAQAAQLLNSFAARTSAGANIADQAERHQRAHKALNQQAEGVVTP